MTTVQPLNPPGLKTPAGPYSHGILVNGPARWLITTGQVALERDGTIPSDPEAQCRLIWRHLTDLLSAAGMGIEDIVRLGVYAVSPEVLAVSNLIRNEVLGPACPTTTAIIVAGLANPAYLIEIEITACTAEIDWPKSP